MYGIGNLRTPVLVGEMGAAEVEAFLTYLAVELMVPPLFVGNNTLQK